MPATRLMLAAFSTILLMFVQSLDAKPTPLDPRDGRGGGTQRRTIAGDLCGTALDLPRGATITFDLCRAWNDYDPGAHGCSTCALPGPDVALVLDTQSGEDLRLTLDVHGGDADVRLYLVSDCGDVQGTCLVASSHASGSVQAVSSGGGALYLIVDTTDGCGLVSVTREAAASVTHTTWGALKAIYY